MDLGCGLRVPSIRRSGTGQISATAMYSDSAINGCQNLVTMPAMQASGDSLPFQSPLTDRLSGESVPSNALTFCCRSQFAIAAMSSTTPYVLEANSRFDMTAPYRALSFDGLLQVRHCP